MFYFLAYFLVFALGINLGKTLSDREHQLASTIQINPADTGGEEGARDRFKKQVALEIERRIRNQVEEQVKTEMENHFKDSAEGESDSSEAAAQAPAKPKKAEKKPEKPAKKNAAKETPPKEAPAKAPVETEAVAKRSSASIGVYSIELSRHADKTDAEKAQKNFQSKGLKAFRRKVASQDGDVDYRIYLGKFGTKEEAKSFQSTVLAKKGLKSTGKVKKIDP